MHWWIDFHSFLVFINSLLITKDFCKLSKTTCFVIKCHTFGSQWGIISFHFTEIDDLQCFGRLSFDFVLLFKEPRFYSLQSKQQTNERKWFQKRMYKFFQGHEKVNEGILKSLKGNKNKSKHGITPQRQKTPIYAPRESHLTKKKETNRLNIVP